MATHTVFQTTAWTAKVLDGGSIAAWLVSFVSRLLANDLWLCSVAAGSSPSLIDIFDFDSFVDLHDDRIHPETGYVTPLGMSFTSDT